jgi:enamine deaminase RidA (YjgF/YER057c/UK114 family)
MLASADGKACRGTLALAMTPRNGRTASSGKLCAARVTSPREAPPMITDRIDPPELLKIPEIVNVSIATGSRVIHISGQTSVEVEGKVVGSTHLEQSRLAFRNALIALAAAGATLYDVAKLNIYMVDYSWDALEELMAAAKEVFGDPYPVTANTLVGVASLWLPDLLVEVDAVAIL